MSVDSKDKEANKQGSETTNNPSTAVRKPKYSKGIFSAEQNNLYQMNLDKILSQNSLDWKTRLKVIEYGQQRKEVFDLDNWCQQNA